MRQHFRAWLLENAEEIILRWIFRSALVVTIAMLAFNLAEMQGWIAYPDAATAPTEIREDSPALKLPGILPSILAPLLPDGDNRLTPLPQPDGAMAKPMTFELVGGGRDGRSSLRHGIQSRAPARMQLRAIATARWVLPVPAPPNGGRFPRPAGVLLDPPFRGWPPTAMRHTSLPSNAPSSGEQPPLT